MRISRFAMMIIAATLVSGVAASCSKDEPEAGGHPNGSAPSMESIDPEVVKLTETNINGTDIAASSNVAGLIFDKTTKKGIPGVPVSDGYSFTVTDKNGVYQMSVDKRCRKVYYTLPSKYKVNLDSKNHLPCFFSPGSMVSEIEANGKCRVDFALEALETPETTFTLLMIGDPQCENTNESGRYKKETLADIKKTADSGKYKNIYAITLGDITFDSTNMWGAMRSTMSNFQAAGGYIPFFQTIGNHDHNSLEKDTSDNLDDDYRATDKFTTFFGPTDYSFDRGDAHIIVMDDIIVSSIGSSSRANGKTWNYDSSGGFTADQWKWLQSDLNNVKDKENKVVFLCCHIQFRSSTTNYKGSVLNAFKQFKEAHIMIGHTHYPQNYIQTSYVCKGGEPIYEHIHGAACGAWWASDSNVTGAPNGYSLYTVSDGSVKDWIAKGSNHEEEYQMRVYNGNQTFTGSKGYSFQWFNASNIGGSSSIAAPGYPQTQGCFVAEIWDDDASNWTVEMFQDGKKVGDFTHIPNGKCVNVPICAFWFNEKGKNTDTWANKTCSHYWYYLPKSGRPDKEQNWEVRATQVIPTNKSMTHVYTCNTLTTDYKSF